MLNTLSKLETCEDDFYLAMTLDARTLKSIFYQKRTDNLKKMKSVSVAEVYNSKTSYSLFLQIN